MTLAFLATPWSSAVIIFFCRVADMALDTVRVLFVVRGKKLLSWILGFFQSLIFVLAISTVLSQLDNPLNILGYAAGFATGNVVGMLIEERLAIGFIRMTVISSTRGTAVAQRLRTEGFGVTEIPARGKNGTVEIIQCNVQRKEIKMVQSIIIGVDEEAFVTIDDIRPVRRGFFRA